MNNSRCKGTHIFLYYVYFALLRCCVIVVFIVFVAYVGSYRQWPRWAPRPDRSVAVTVRVGAPFRLRDLLAEPTPAAVEALVRERLAALRDPDEHRVDPSPFPGARPELVL